MTTVGVVGRQITVRGRVQGVGFRPFVWRLAHEAAVTGHVLNDGAGVRIEVWGKSADLDRLLHELERDPPLLARIEAVVWTVLEGLPPDQFQIVQSGGGDINTQVTPDAATCPDCLREICDPADRRYRYAFTNCTHCGPRLSIVEGIPYDRARTSMRTFDMCDDCRREYEDPADRRFHAQPNACPVCGPRLWIEDVQGEVAGGDPIHDAVRRLRDSQIIAVKGIGGFHLTCDATNADVVAELRRRKRRVAKPLALMAKDLDQIREFCDVTGPEADLLSSSIAPIVLLRNRDRAGLIGVAPGLNCVGVMLPQSPLHHLLLAEFGGPLVMTSGNAANTPQVTDNAQARTDLAGIADAWLLHDRDIVNRLDDSIMRVDLAAPVVFRRGRGMAPAAIRLHERFAEAPPTLAMGAELKSTFCLIKGVQAIPSQHIGDLKNAETYADYREKVTLFRDLYQFDPAVVAVDLHPDYLSTKWGERLAQDTGATLIRVQHHHAHLVGCLAEHQVDPEDAKTVGVILDGTGLGTDGTIWGGEILLGDYAGFERKAHFAPVALPGGEQAVLEPWRNLVAHLVAAFGIDWRVHLVGTGLAGPTDEKPVDLIERMIAQRLNAPLASSAGRLFDAVAAALGIVFDRQHYEGQAAMELEALVAGSVPATGYPVCVADNTLSWRPMWMALLDDLRSGVDHGVIAARFHGGLVVALADVVTQVATEAGTGRIVLSGGVMQNRLLVEGVYARLRSNGFNVLAHRQVPANDGGISLGQAAIAALS